jgi:Cu/Ag efflux pump CusA
MSDVAGAYFNVLTNSMIITLTCSFVVTWLALPVIFLLVIGKGKFKVSHHEVKHQTWVHAIIRHPWIGLIIIVGFLSIMLVLLPKLQTGFLPEMDEGSIVLDYTSPPGTSLEETDKMLQELEKLIVKVPEVETYSRRTGTEMGFFITEPNMGDYLIQLKKHRNRTTEEVIEDIRLKAEASVPGLTVDFGQVIGDMLGDLMASVQPIEVKVFGNSPEKLNELAKNIAEEISQVEGTVDVFDGIIIAGPSVIVKPDAVRLAQFGLTAASLQYQLQTALEGNVVGDVYSEVRFSPIRIVYPGSLNLNVEQMQNQQIFLPDGKLIPLGRVADVLLESGETEIQRENLQSVGVVTARLNNRDLGTVMKEIQQKILSHISLPKGCHIEFGGSFASQQQSFSELFLILIIASLLVFLVILFLFKNFIPALLILLISVSGIAGSVAALYFTNTPLNVGSYTGIIMIVGIISENAVFTFLQFNESRLGKDIDHAIVYAISTRLRPKLMTAIGAIIALLPIALGIGTGSQLHQPLAIAVIGGFIAALPLLLIALPGLIKLTVKD